MLTQTSSTHAAASSPGAAHPLPADNLHIGCHTPTPLVPVRVDRTQPVVWTKLEFLNPSGSTKDRVAIHILTKAFRSGAVKRGQTVIEASSGSTSIAMAMTCAQLGLRFIAVMPEGVSNERSMMIRAYGGQTQLVPREAGMIGCIEKSRELAAACDGFLPRQFENADNADAHRFGTARELIEQMPGHCVDVVVSGVGTGGTLAGLYQGCRDMGCNVTPVLAKPVALSGPRHYEHGCFTDAECCSFRTCIPGVMDNM